MLVTGYRWLLLRPLLRGGMLFLGIAALCSLSLWTAPVISPAAPAAIVVAPATDPAAAPEQHTEWPRTVLRLWFLVPQLLPTYDR